MKRYNFREKVMVVSDITADFKSKMFEDPNGEWIKWEDQKSAFRLTEIYEDQIRELKNEIGRLKATIGLKKVGVDISHFGVEHGVLKVQDVTECNCSNFSNMEFRSRWVCPKHGYKRI